jgi:hypothetical protein
MRTLVFLVPLMGGAVWIFALMVLAIVVSEIVRVEVSNAKRSSPKLI